jgi:RNA:NAD 2'-phosphotransferase (TPT1/KptA family)
MWRNTEFDLLFRLSSNGVWLAEHVPPDYLWQLS